MSTFDGLIREFPGIRVDFFRGVAANPPLASFLSHIHSDHLAGLDTYKGRHVYCSAATRAMLLKLQRYSSRINLHDGILEKEELTYKHQKRRLKPLPLETPTDIELEPGNTIRVTLFDANHCPGAVMFLFEGNGKAVLYTGDIRSEPWYINALVRNPSMIEYASGLKTLDKVYLDTSFTEDIIFQTKAEGLRELIEKVSKYPKETKFHFSSWTYGYEQVWIALSRALNSQVHVDDYKLEMYKSLQVRLEDDQYIHLSPEAPALTGFSCGNGFQKGILTRDETARLHSCEKGTRCSTMQSGGVVFITPIVAHLNNNDMAEVGIGGGAGDLEQKDELLLEPQDAHTLLQSINTSKDLHQDAKASLARFLLNAASAQRPVTLSVLHSDDDENPKNPTDLRMALKYLTRASGQGRGKVSSGLLPSRIKFPYSRHSSYRELCQLLQALKPNDVWPCTVEPVRWIKEGITIKGLFGDYCTGNSFHHDEYLSQLATSLSIEDSEQNESQTSVDSIPHEMQNFPISEVVFPGEAPELTEKVSSSQVTTASLQNDIHVGEISSESHGKSDPRRQTIDLTPTGSDDSQNTTPRHKSLSVGKRTFKDFSTASFGEIQKAVENTIEEDDFKSTEHLLDSQESSVSAWALETRRTAFNAMFGNAAEWAGLLSTTNNHTNPERELGED